jgi:hypothetical protein
MAPDMQLASWGSCMKPPNVELYQPYEKRKLYDQVFDLAIFTSWSTDRPEARHIHAKKYVWGVISWKNGVMVNGYFKDNEYVARWFRGEVEKGTPDYINFKDRVFMLCQPFGNEIGESKFKNKRVAWVAKEAFDPGMNPEVHKSAKKHLIATIDAVNRAGAALSIFCCKDFDPQINPVIGELGIQEELEKCKKLTMHPTLPFKEYQRELGNCSVTMAMAFAGSSIECIMKGLVPVFYKDHVLAMHPWILNTVKEITRDRESMIYSEDNTLTQQEISDITYELLTDEDKFNEYLWRLRPIAYDHLDSSVLRQLDKLMAHKCGTEYIRS